MRNRVLHILSLIIIAAAVWSCRSDSTNEDADSSFREANGGRYYGGTFRLNETEYIKSLFPHNVVDVYSYRVASQIYEGLFKFNQENLEVINGLAESYELDSSKTVYTIKLIKGVYFHDDDAFPGGKGREVTAEDIAYCFSLLCSQHPYNQGFHTMDGLLKGARKYFDASAGNKKPDFELEGVKVIDRYTVQLILEKPNALFPIYLARPEAFIFAKEAYEKYGIEMRIKAVGTGPFKLATVDENNSIILKRNPNYYRSDQYGNKLPLLNAINIQFIRDKRTELFEFKKGKLDMMYRLPTDYIIEILQETEANADGGFSNYPLQREAENQTQLFSFLNQHPVFKDVNVRKAFSFAIDRRGILEYVLNGEGYEAGLHGITPPSFSWYDIRRISGFDFNKDSALYYLSKAGYPLGKGFPQITLDLNAEGDRHTNVAVEVKRQLKETLNIDIELNVVPHAEIVDKCLNGNYAMVRLSWVADYPSPESFLKMFYSKYVPEKIGVSSYPNVPRYINAKFDDLYEKALSATTREDAIRYFQAAETEMMKDAPVIILWYDECYRLLQPRVKNFPNNAMQYRDFSEVYVEPAENEVSGNSKKS